MDLTKLSPIEIRQLYDAGGFFVLNGLPLASHFAIDGHSSVTGPRFQGLKLVPPGFHLITFVPGPKSEASKEGPSAPEYYKPASATHIGQQINRGLIRFFEPQEIVIKTYDEAEETFHQPGPHEPEITISSRDHMKSLDTGLAPYPIQHYSSWKSLTSQIQPSLVKQVFGLTNSNEVIIDSLMCNDEVPGLSEKHVSCEKQTCTIPQVQQQTQCPKAPSQTCRIEAIEPDTLKASYTRWPTINLKRSWPKDCVGEELTRWSRDKSWLFHQFIIDQNPNKDLNNFLGLIQLSFLTFLHLHSFQSLQTYQLLLTLLSRSTIKELSTFDQRYPTLFIEVVIQLSFQLEQLHTEFFVDMQDPQLEDWLFKTICLLRNQLDYITKHVEQQQPCPKLLAEITERRWPALRSTCKRFDWNFKPLRQNRENPTGIESEDDSDLISEEDDDEKPVVVEI